jgi:hypothetical protein
MAPKLSKRKSNFQQKIVRSISWFLAQNVLTSLCNIFIVIPALLDDTPAARGGLIGTIAGGVAGLIYPLLLIVFLSMGKVKDAMK